MLAIDSGLSRRQFLGATARWLLTTTALRPLAACSNESTPIDADWNLLARSLQGSLLRPGSSEYANGARPNNLRFASTLPAGIARCVGEEDVAAAIRWATSQGVPLITRSGGHNYAGYSTTTGLMIDVSPMNSVEYRTDGGHAVLGGGARNANVYAGLQPVGAAVTHGRCLEVGVAGLVLGGGLGFNMRKHGLTCDQLLETTMVDASGNILRASATENSDLFWACRGAAGNNFGIHTSFTFQTFPVGQVTAFDITWEDEIDRLFSEVLTLLEDAPEDLGIKLYIGYPGAEAALRVNLLGQYVGEPAALRSFFAPLYAIASPTEERVDLVPYWDAQQRLSEEGDPGYYHERSRFPTATLSAEVQRAILSQLRAWPGTSRGTNFKIFFAGGAVMRKGATETAYVHRQSPFLTSLELDWSESDDPDVLVTNSNWLDDTYAILEDTGPGAYQNFVDPALTTWAEAYYGENLPRLMQVKAAVDPTNVFRYPQSIPGGAG